YGIYSEQATNIRHAWDDLMVHELNLGWTPGERDAIAIPANRAAEVLQCPADDRDPQSYALRGYQMIAAEDTSHPEYTKHQRSRGVGQFYRLGPTPVSSVTPQPISLANSDVPEP